MTFDLFPQKRDVILHPLNVADAWDFEEVYGALHDFSRQYEFNTDANDYLIHITTGTHVAQICLFLLTESTTSAWSLATSLSTQTQERPRRDR